MYDAGAIPVFLGPPFHSMPFAEVIDYSDIGLVYNITGARPWLSNDGEAVLNELPLTIDGLRSPATDEVQPLTVIQARCAEPCNVHGPARLHLESSSAQEHACS